MFGSAIYFISLSLPDEQEIVNSDFGMGLYEAFLRQYELGYGEYSEI